MDIVGSVGFVTATCHCWNANAARQIRPARSKGTLFEWAVLFFSRSLDAENHILAIAALAIV
jgi:hypothetical protein